MLGPSYAVRHKQSLPRSYLTSAVTSRSGRCATTSCTVCWHSIRTTRLWLQWPTIQRAVESTACGNYRSLPIGACSCKLPVPGPSTKPKRSSRHEASFRKRFLDCPNLIALLCRTRTDASTISPSKYLDPDTLRGRSSRRGRARQEGRLVTVSHPKIFRSSTRRTARIDSFVLFRQRGDHHYGKHDKARPSTPDRS